MPTYIAKDGVFEKMSYTTEDILNAVDMLGVERYGNISYLELTVTSQFEGCSRNELYPYSAVLQERDGSVVWLQNATNGIQHGVYYSSITLGEDQSITSYSPSGTSYKPIYIGENRHAWTVGCSLAEGVVWGTLREKKADGKQLYFLGLTNGTLDHTQHEGGLFTIDQFGLWGTGTGNITSGSSVYMVLSGDYVYLIARVNLNNLQVYRTPVSSIPGNQNIVFERVVGWTVEGIHTTRSNSDNIVLSDAVFKTELVDETNTDFMIDNVTEVDSPFTFGSVAHLFASNISPGKIRLLNNEVGQFLRYDVYRQAYPGWAIDIDFDAKMVTTLPQSKDGYFSIVDKGTGVSWSGKLDTANKFGPIFGAQDHTSKALTADGTLVTLQGHNEGVGRCYLSRSTNFTNKVDALDWNINGFSQVREVSIPRLYSSVMGGNVRSPVWFDQDTLMVSAEGNAPNDIYRLVESSVFSRLTGEPDFVYDTQSYGPMSGFTPQPRYAYPSQENLGIKHSLLFSESVDTGVCKIAGACVIEADKAYPVAVSGSLLPTATLTISASVFTGIYDDIMEAQSLVTPTTIIQRATSIIVPSNPTLPVVAAVMLVCVDTDGVRKGGVFYYRATLPSRVGTVSEYELGELVHEQLVLVQPTATFSRFDTAMSPNCSWYSTPDNKYMCFYSQPYAMNPVGGQYVTGLKFVVDGVSGDVVAGTTSLYTISTWYHGQEYYGVIPKVGMVRYDVAVSRQLSGTGLAYRSIGRTYADFMANALSATQILISNQVPAGYNFYIPEVVPMLTRGKKYEIPATSLNLADFDAAPGNKTFHVFTFYDAADDEVRHVVSLDDLTDENHRYIGSVVTNSTQIESTSISKRTFIHGYPLSLTRKGGSIPIAPGLPTSTSNNLSEGWK